MAAREVVAAETVSAEGREEAKEVVVDSIWAEEDHVVGRAAVARDVRRSPQ